MNQVKKDNICNVTYRPGKPSYSVSCKTCVSVSTAAPPRHFVRKKHCLLFYLALSSEEF